MYVFDVAYLFGVRISFTGPIFPRLIDWLASSQFFVASGVYITLSFAFPAQETILASPILDLDDARAYAAEHDDTYAQGYEYDNDEKSVTEDGGRERGSAEKEKDPYDVRVQPA